MLIRSSPPAFSPLLSFGISLLLLICLTHRFSHTLCRVSGEISDGDTASRLDRVLASMRIPKKEFDDVTSTYGSLIAPLSL